MRLKWLTIVEADDGYTFYTVHINQEEAEGEK